MLCYRKRKDMFFFICEYIYTASEIIVVNGNNIFYFFVIENHIVEIKERNKVFLFWAANKLSGHLPSDTSFG